MQQTTNTKGPQTPVRMVGALLHYFCGAL